MANLKPCPFCGGKATWFYDNCEDDTKDWGIQCTDYPCYAEINGFSDFESAVEAWNRRVNDG